MPRAVIASSHKSTRLTPEQHALLSIAKARKDRIVALPANAKGPAATRLSTKLLKLGLVQEVAARGAMSIWRREGDRNVALKLTTAGSALLQDAVIEPGSVTVDEQLKTRAASKIARVIARLAAVDGATVPDLMVMTGWLPHTTRAALTGLRRRGFNLVREPNTNGPSVYYIRGTPQAGGSTE